MSWYNLTTDNLETLATEIFYCELGTDYANFSLGLFQMKPSFIESIENEFDKSYFKKDAKMQRLKINSKEDSEKKENTYIKIKKP